MNNIKNISEEGSKLILKASTQITPSTGTQATHITDVTTAGLSTTDAAAINSIIAALENVGILASS